MALFEGNKRVEGSRSNTTLVKSGHMSPAEDWLLDQRFKDADMSGVFREGILFNYSYGGTGTEDVVIPKGRIVGVSAPVKDFVSKKFKTVMTMPGLASGGNTIGMVPYNICKDYFQTDRFGGNKPSIITLDYVTLPYIPSVEGSGEFSKAGILAEEQALSVDNRMPWGAVIGANVKDGDYLKASPSGRLVKWDRATDNAVDIVGQVLASDLNQEPWGWMKWMLWNEADAKGEDGFINRSGASNLPTDYGYPFDPKYADGNNVYENYQKATLTNPTGFPGLHDGSGNYDSFGRNDTPFTGVSLGAIPAGVADDTLMSFQIKDYAGGNIVNVKEVSALKIGGVAVTADRLTVDHKNGIVTVKLLAVDSGKAVTADYKVFFYGTPSYLDFKGVVGSLFVLLKK